jgi:hypothetical protein
MTSIAVGQRFGAWEVVGVEGRRASCRCRCGVVRAISVDAIVAGTAAPSCGCAPLSRRQFETLHGEASLRKRRRALKSWRPGQ